MKPSKFRMSERRIRDEIAWLIRSEELAKTHGQEPNPEVAAARRHLENLLKTTPPEPAQPDTAESVVAEFGAKTLEKLHRELWRYHKMAENVGLDHLSDRLSMACALVLRLKQDVEYWREVSPHIGWRCRWIYRAAQGMIMDDVRTYGTPTPADDEITTEQRSRMWSLRRDLQSDTMQSCVDAIGIVTIVANDVRKARISGVTACRDAAMAYISHSLKGII
jgi:hypothetical protein